MQRDPRDDARLCRLALVRSGLTDVARDERLLGALETDLSNAGRRQVECLRHHWEWAEAVLSSPVRRARQTAALLARRAGVTLEARLRPRGLGRWEGRTPAELRAAWPEIHARWQAGDPELEPVAAESDRAFRVRIAALVERLLAGPERSLLVVSHLGVIREVARQLAGPLPPGRPWPAEMVLLTRREDGHFRLGRRTSDPEPLRTPFERTGLSGATLERPPERHVAPLTIEGAWAPSP